MSENIGVVGDKVEKYCNVLRNTATKYLLKSSDTAGRSIMLGNKSFSSRESLKKIYYTLYAYVSIERDTYQSSQGGKLYSYLDINSIIFIGSTLKYAKMLFPKYTI